jgi:adenosylcobinamide-phosphate synthase
VVSGGERGAGAVAVAAGLVVDRVVGDPPDRWHPVAWFGAAMARREARHWRDDRAAGLLHTAVGVGAAAVAGAATSRLAGAIGHRSAATVVTVTVVVGGRSLDRAATRIGGALEAGDLDTARRLLPGLVGRDPTHLDAGEISRAVIESVAENTVDAVVAPVLWACIAGPAGAAAYRAANTLDAMVGHRSARYRNFGWASARLDDLANLVPARVAALIVAAVRPRRALDVWRTVRGDAAAHPSPNAGVIEAAFAAALGLRLGGTNIYDGRVETRSRLGAGAAPDAGDIRRARYLARDVNLALGTALLAPAGAAGLRRWFSADYRTRPHGYLKRHAERQRPAHPRRP